MQSLHWLRSTNQSRPLPLLLGALSLATQPQGTNQSRPLPQLLGALSLATQPQGTTQVCTPKYVTIVIVLEGIHRACTHAIMLSPCARNATISHLSNSKLLLVLALLLLLLLPLSLFSDDGRRPPYRRPAPPHPAARQPPPLQI